MNHKEALLNACRGYRTYVKMQPGTLMMTDIRFEHGRPSTLVRHIDELDLVLIVSVQPDDMAGDEVHALDLLRGHVHTTIMPGHYRQRAIRVKASCS